MPRLASSTQLSISEGVRSNCRLASATVVLPWMISSTSADFRRAVQRLISSSITALIDVSFARLHLSRFSLGHYTDAATLLLYANVSKGYKAGSFPGEIGRAHV